MANKAVKIIYHRVFVKHFKRRIASRPIVASFCEQRFTLFLKDRAHPLLKDHRLTGDMVGKRAFWIGGDIRVVYREKIPGVFEFMDIGNHNQVYK